MPNNIDMKPKGPDTIPNPKQKTDPKLKTVVIPYKPQVQLSVKETVELVEFVVALANAIAKYSKSGKSIAMAIWYFGPVALKLPGAIIGLNKIPAEIKVLTSSQKNSIVAQIYKELAFDNNVKDIVGQSLDIAFKIKTLIDIFR